MKKKLLRLSIIIMSGFLIGLINTIFIYEGFWSHFNKGIQSVSWYIHLIYWFISLFLVILVHELGHFFSFVKHKIKVKALYALFIAFVKEDNKIKIRFVPKFLLLVGGIVIPDKQVIDNKEKEDEIINIIDKVLIAGPNTSLWYGLSIIIVWFIFLFTNLYYLSGFLFTMMVTTIILTFLVVKSSKISRGTLYGDYVASKKIRTDSLFQLTYLYQLVTLIERDQNSINYLWPRIIEQLYNQNVFNNSLYLNLINIYLEEVTYYNQIGSTGVEHKFDKIINRLSTKEDGFAMMYSFIYFYQSRKDFNKVNELLNRIKNKEYKINKKVKLFYEKYTNHLLKISDETNFLSKPKNIVPSSLSWIYDPLRLPHEIKEIK